MTTSATETSTSGQAGQEEAIKKVVNDYYVGLRDGDLVSLGKAFNDLAVVCGYIETELFEKHVKTLYDYVLAEEPQRLVDFVHTHVDVDPSAVVAEGLRRRGLVPL